MKLSYIQAGLSSFFRLQLPDGEDLLPFDAIYDTRTVYGFLIVGCTKVMKRHHLKKNSDIIFPFF